MVLAQHRLKIRTLKFVLVAALLGLRLETAVSPRLVLLVTSRVFGAAVLRSVSEKGVFRKGVFQEGPFSEGSRESQVVMWHASQKVRNPIIIKAMKK